MELEYAILARYAEHTPEGMLTLVGGDHNSHVAVSFPHLIKMLTLAVRVSLGQDETSKPHAFRCEIVDQESGEVTAIGAKGTIPRINTKNHAEDAKFGIGLVLQISNVAIPRPGKYDIRIVIDDEVIGKRTFRVAAGGQAKHFVGPKLSPPGPQT